MNREKFAWMLSIVLISILAFKIPGTLAHRDDDYAFARKLIDIHRQISSNYVDKPDEGKLEQGAIEGMLNQLDPYTNYVPPANQEQFDNMLDGSFRGVGIQLDSSDKGEIKVISPIDGSPAAKAGIEPGDIITKVNGEDVTKQKLSDVMKKVKGPRDTTVTLTVRHVDGQVADLTMKRDDIVMPTVKGMHRLVSAKPSDEDQWDFWVNDSPKIAYVRITQFTSETSGSLKKAMDKLMAGHMQGLILDLRFNPGGRLEQAKDIVNLFVKEGVIVKVKGRNRPEEVTYAKKDSALRDFPMVVMVNEQSASAAEIVSGSLKDNKRALVIGTRSFGKGSVQELIPMEDNGGELKLTVAYYYLPSGRLVHRKKDASDWGVEPQLNVPMDENQEKALLQYQIAVDVMNGRVKPATMPATAPAATAPALTKHPADPQFDAALKVLTDDIKSGGNAVVPVLPTTRP